MVRSAVRLALVALAALLPFGLLGPGADAETYAASYALRAPASIATGAVATVPVLVTNTGTTTWNARGAGPVDVAYHWRRAEGSLLVWDGMRTALDGDVPAGASRLVDAQVRAPDAAGTYRLELALVKEGVAWFDPAPAVTVAAVALGGAAFQADLGAAALTGLLAGRGASVDVTVRNAGTAAWSASGANPVDLAYHWYDVRGALVTWDGARTALGSDLAPGATRTLHAAVVAPATPGTYVLVLEMVREGVAWFGPQLARGAPVGDPASSATYQAPSNASGFIAEQRTLDVTVTNAGAVAWPAGGATPVRLSYHWRDAQGGLVVWDGARTAFPSDVQPGESRTVAMSVTTPARAGAYTMWVDLVREGVAWSSSSGTPPAFVAWQITSGYGASYGATAMAASAVSGASVAATVSLTNTGQRAWAAGGATPVHLSYHLYDAAGRLVVWDGERAAFAGDVAPGATVATSITVRVPTATGSYAVAWDLVQEGVSWFSGLGIAPKRDPFSVAPGVTVYGKGWGHGVGMSQWGAQGWAQGAAGTRKTGEEIVAFYYPGTQLSPVPSSLATVRVLLSAPADGCIARTVTDLTQQRSAGGMRVWNEGTGATIATGSGSPTWAPQQTIRIWIANDGLLHVMDEWAAVQIAAVQGPIRIAPLDAARPITIDQKGPRAYRGELRYAVASQNALRVVDLVGLDDYARGGVPSEMPTGVGWELEAFKAQAYATKTYAAQHAQARAAEAYDVEDDTSDQCYGGASKETALTDQAVAATAGRIITSAGQPIRAFYHSSDGGVTERNGCVFDLPQTNGHYTCDASEPYLQVVNDPADLAASDPRGPNPHANWSASFTAQQLVDAVRQMSGTDIGSFVAIDLSNRSGSGRVVSVRVQGTRATVELAGPAFLRFTLGVKSTLVRTQPF